MSTDNSIKLISMIRGEVNDFILRELKKLGLDNIAPSHGDIFYTLFKHKELTKKEIANKINKDPSTITTLVKKLKKYGFLDERKNPEDRRYTIIFLTDKGKDLRIKFEEISKKLYQIEYEGFTKDERKKFLKFLNRIYSNFK